MKCFHATLDKDPMSYDPIYFVPAIRDAVEQSFVVPFVFPTQAVERMAKMEMGFAIDAVEVVWKDIQEKGLDKETEDPRDLFKS